MPHNSPTTPTLSISIPNVPPVPSGRHEPKSLTSVETESRNNTSANSPESEIEEPAQAPGSMAGTQSVLEQAINHWTDVTFRESLIGNKSDIEHIFGPSDIDLDEKSTICKNISEGLHTLLQFLPNVKDLGNVLLAHSFKFRRDGTISVIVAMGIPDERGQLSESSPSITEVEYGQMRIPHETFRTFIEDTEHAWFSRTWTLEKDEQMEEKGKDKGKGKEREAVEA